MSPDRRGLLRGLVTLPLIGGGVTLIGRPAVAVPLQHVAAAPLVDDPAARARYAWEAFAAAMRDVTAGSTGWHVVGGQRVCAVGHHAAQPSWFKVDAFDTVPDDDQRYPHWFIDRARKIEL